MRELIDREQVLNDMGDRPKVSVHGLYALGAVNQYDIDRLAVETAPTVDVVEVVRCKDCVAFNYKFTSKITGDSWGRCVMHHDELFKEKQFCDLGVRKGGEQ